MKKITAVIIIYNEEDRIDNCLSSIVDFDQIIVIHDGECSDRSLEIAKKYTNEIYILPHKGACDEHRVFGIEKSRNEWVMILDADETISKELDQNLNELILEEDVAIYETLRPLRYKHIYLPLSKRTLFRKSKVSFIGSIHEYIKLKDKNFKIKYTSFEVTHNQGYNNFSWNTITGKYRKRAKVHADILINSNFKDIPKRNSSQESRGFIERVRIQFPIVLGILCSPIYLANGLIKAIKHNNIYFIQWGYATTLYYVLLYFFVCKKKYLSFLN